MVLVCRYMVQRRHFTALSAAWIPPGTSTASSLRYGPVAALWRPSARPVSEKVSISGGLLTAIIMRLLQARPCVQQAAHASPRHILRFVVLLAQLKPSDINRAPEMMTCKGTASTTGIDVCPASIPVTFKADPGDPVSHHQRAESVRPSADPKTKDASAAAPHRCACSMHNPDAQSRARAVLAKHLEKVRSSSSFPTLPS